MVIQSGLLLAAARTQLLQARMDASRPRPDDLLDDSVIDHVARLARLELTEDEKAKMRRELSQILDHFADLSQLDTDQIPPTAMVVSTELPLREDDVGESLSQQQALANAPEPNAGFFAVPPVLDQ